MNTELTHNFHDERRRTTTTSLCCCVVLSAVAHLRRNAATAREHRSFLRSSAALSWFASLHRSERRLCWCVKAFWAGGWDGMRGERSTAGTSCSILKSHRRNLCKVWTVSVRTHYCCALCCHVCLRFLLWLGSLARRFNPASPCLNGESFWPLLWDKALPR